MPESIAQRFVKNIQGGNASTVKQFLDKHTSVDLNSVDRKLGTPFVALAASKGGKVGVVKLMCDYGANISLAGENGMTAIHYAVKFGNMDVVDFIINRYPSEVNRANGMSGYTPAHYAVELASADKAIEMLTLLKKGGASLKKGDHNKETPLFKVLGKNVPSGSDSSVLVQYLLVNGVNVNSRNHFSSTPLHCAAKGTNFQTMSMLCSKGAELNVKDWAGCTPLHYAVEGGDKFIVKCLIERGATKDIKDNLGRVPTDCTPDQVVRNLVATGLIECPTVTPEDISVSDGDESDVEKPDSPPDETSVPSGRWWWWGN